MVVHEHIRYHPGAAGGGTDTEAHKLDHRTLVTDLPQRLKGTSVREKRAMRPKIRRAVRELMSSAEVTGGNPVVHRDVSVTQINRLLPPYLRISARHIR